MLLSADICGAMDMDFGFVVESRTTGNAKSLIFLRPIDSKNDDEAKSTFHIMYLHRNIKVKC